MTSLTNVTLVAFVLLHLGAVVTAWATRVAHGSRVERVVQLVFLAAMTGVGVCAWYCHASDLGLGIPSGATLIAMVLTAVTDFRRTQEPPQAPTLSLHR